MHAVRDDYAVHDGTSHVPSMGKTTIPACKGTSSLFLKAFSVGSRNFTTRGRLLSRYRSVPKRPLAFDVSSIFLSHAKNND